MPSAASDTVAAVDTVADCMLGLGQAFAFESLAVLDCEPGIPAALPEQSARRHLEVLPSCFLNHHCFQRSVMMHPPKSPPILLVVALETSNAR